MKARVSRRMATIIGCTGAAVLACGAAYAYWGTTGSGGGSSAALVPVAVTLTPATPTAQLYPGSVSDVVLTVSNSNATSAHISTLALDTTQGSSGFAVDSTHSGCTLSSLSYAAQSNGVTGWTVPGKVGSTNGTLAVTLSNALSMTVSAPNACQGATFTVYLAAS